MPQQALEVPHVIDAALARRPKVEARQSDTQTAAGSSADPSASRFALALAAKATDMPRLRVEIVGSNRSYLHCMGLLIVVS